MPTVGKIIEDVRKYEGFNVDICEDSTVLEYNHDIPGIPYKIMVVAEDATVSNWRYIFNKLYGYSSEIPDPKPNSEKKYYHGLTHLKTVRDDYKKYHS